MTATLLKNEIFIILYAKVPKHPILSDVNDHRSKHWSYKTLKNLWNKLIQFEKIQKILEKHMQNEKMDHPFYHINGVERFQSHQGTS